MARASYNAHDVRRAAEARRGCQRRRLDRDQVAELRRRYVEDGVTIEALAKDLGIALMTVYRALHGIAGYRGM